MLIVKPNKTIPICSGIVETFDDHRIAMTGVIANIAINAGITSDNIECISDSYPSFFEDLHKIGASYDY